MVRGNSEDRFWAETLRAAQGGVLVSPAGVQTSDVVCRGSGDVHVYAADLRTGWIRCGLYQGQDMDVARGVATQPGWQATMLPVVADHVCDAANECASESDPVVLQVLGLAMAAATVSGTHHIVLRDRGSCAGHWFFLVYTARDGSRAWNTAFAGAEGNGFLGGAALGGFLQQVLRANLQEGMAVGARMLAGGGVVLAPNLNALMGHGL